MIYGLLVFICTDVMEDHKKKGKLVSFGNGVIKPFGKKSFSVFSSLLYDMRPVLNHSRFRRIMWLGVLSTMCLFVLMKWCHATRSMGLQVYTYLILFDILCLGICILSIWVEQKKPNRNYTFGYERFEVLAIFLSTTFAAISSFFIAKKSIERWINQSQIHTGRLLPGIILSFLCHLIITYCMKNRGLNHVICASSSSWLQSHVTTVSQSICRVLPGLSSALLPRINPFVLVGWIAGGMLLIAHVLIDLYDYHGADSIAAVCIAFMICVTMFPMSAYSGKILLQGTPPHIVDLLNKCLREASTLDGVLEFRNEHFWLLGYDKIVGSVHVRVRRDANEQVVLAHLMDKLSSLVSDITIQVFKDEWAWSSSTLQILNESFVKFPPSSNISTMPLSSNAQMNNVKAPFVNKSVGTPYSSLMAPAYPGPRMSSEFQKPVNSPSSSSPHAPTSVPLSRPSAVRNSHDGNFSIDMSNPRTAPPAPSLPVYSQTGQYIASQYQPPISTPRTAKTDTNPGESPRNLNPLFSNSPNLMHSYPR